MSARQEIKEIKVIITPSRIYIHNFFLSLSHGENIIPNYFPIIYVINKDGRQIRVSNLRHIVCNVWLLCKGIQMILF